MVGRLIQTARSAYQYPLIFKQLWHTPRVQAPDQEIVYRDLKRFTYLQIKERIGPLASALSKAGVVPGDTVGVLDWDSHRFLEAFFAIPMKWGERPLALVVKRPSDTNDVSETAIKDHLKVFTDKGVISKYGIPEKIIFVDSIPKTSVGKINKKELRERYGDM